MGIKRRKYYKEQKEEIVQRALSGERILALGKEHNPPRTYQPPEETIFRRRIK